MKLRFRVMLFAFGALVALYGLDMMHRGVWLYQNTWYRGTNYSPGTVAIGVFISLLAFLPPTSLADRFRKKVYDYRGSKRRHRSPSN